MNKIYRLVWNSAQRAWVVAGEFSAAKGKGKNCPRRLSLKAITASGLVLAALGTSQLANAYTVAGASLVNGGTAASDNSVATNTAFGSGASASGTNSTAVGQSSSATGNSSLALGDTATALGDSSIALGKSKSNGIYTIAIGDNASASSLETAGAIAIGTKSTASFDGATAIGANSAATELNAVAIGRSTKANGDSAVAIGDQTQATAEHSLAIGGASKATGLTSTAVGWKTASSAENALAFGNFSTASGKDAAVIGSSATASGTSSLALGKQAQASASSTIAIGDGAMAPVFRSIAIGTNAGTGGTAIVPTTGSNIALGSDAGQNVSDNGINQGGSNVAISTKAGIGVKGRGNQAFGVQSGNNVTGNDNVAMAYKSGINVVGNYNHAQGINAGNDVTGNANISVGANSGSTITGNDNLAFGQDAGNNVTADRTLSLGRSTSAKANDAIAIGTNSVAGEVGSVALGSNSVTAAAVATTNTTIAGKLYGFAGISPLSTLSIGGVGTERTITNVAAGRISDTSTDAINGSQLYATNSAINLLDENAVKYDLNPGGTVNHNSVTLGGTTYDNSTHLGGTTITNVANGVAPSDAVNVSQLTETNTNINNIYTTGTKYFHANSTKADSQAVGVDSISVGPQAMANGVNSIAQGLSATANGLDSIALGRGASATAGTTSSALAVGAGTVAVGNNSMAIGGSAKTAGTGGNNFALGGGIAGDAITNTGSNIAFGRNTAASGGYAVGLGFSTTASGSFSTALGGGAVASGKNSVALGGSVSRDTSATTTVDDGIALGSYTVANTAGGVAGYLPAGATAAQIGAISATTGTLGAVSVGNASGGVFRQINGLAAGTVDSDAVNVAQLKGAVGSATADAVMYDPGTSHNSVTLGGTTYDNSTHLGGTTITNVANGVAPSDAVNVSQLTETNTNISNIYATGTKYFHANSTGTDSVASALDSIAIGMGAVADVARSVALGDGAKTEAAVATTGTTIAGEDYLFAGMAPIGTVSVGKAGEERTLTNVAAGRLSATSTDGVNGSQLFATNSAIDVLDQNAVKYDLNPDGTINYNSVTMGGDTYNSVNKTGGTKITNVARGVDDSDAVNVSQLNETNNNVTIIGDTLTNIAGDTSTSYTDVHGTGIRYVRTNEAGLTASDSSAEGQGSTAVGYNATSQGESSLALGREALAKNADDVALGSGSITDIAVGTSGAKIAGVDYAFAGTNPLSTVSVGSLGHERTITNVAAGRLSETSTDGVNGSQLFATNTAIDVLDQNAVKYDLNPDGTINYNSVTMGGDTYNSVTKTGGTKITNVARGVDDSDAVNVSQLNETNTNVTNIGDTLTNIAGDTSTSYTNVHGAGIRYVRTNEAGLVASDSSAEGQGSTAVGYNATSQGESSLALGREALAQIADGVALGSKSVANTLAGIAGYIPAGATAAQIAAISATTSTLGAVSIGDVSTGLFRQINGLAAGTVDSDAVNVAQLKGAVGSATADAVMYDPGTNHNSVTLGGTTYDNSTHVGGTTITNVARGVDDSDAVNVSQLNETNNNVTIIGDTLTNIAGDTSTSYTDVHGTGIRYVRTNEAGLTASDSSAEGQGSTAVGYNATSQGESSLALGREALAKNADDVALGSGSITDIAVGTSGAKIAGVDYAFAGTNPLSTVSVGSLGHERTITNVAAGRLSAESTDAINGSQLFATNTAIDVLDQNAVKYDLNPDGTINYNSVTMGGDTYNSVTKTGGTKITNVARGVDDSDAVNVSQLNETNTNVTNIGDTLTNIAGDTSTSYTNVHGTGIRYVRTNEAGLVASDSSAEGQGSTALGYNAVSKGESSLAMGREAQANNADDVALGSGSITDIAVGTSGAKIADVDYAFAGINPLSTVSVGSLGRERTITNVAAGRLSAESTDAINGSQLFATNSAINTLDKGSVKYEINNDGSVNYNSIKLAGDTYNNVTKTGGTSITNVAYGIDDSDAVNVQQLNDATTNIYNGGTKYFHANSVKADSVASGIDSIAVGPEAKSIGNGSIAMGNAAQSTGNGSMALGQNAQSVGENSVAMGVGAIASNAGDIALGAGSTTAAAVATTGTTIAGNHYDFAGTAPTSTLSIGSEGAERTITNVAAGRIDASSTDAVNGSQLYATNQAIGNISSVISTIDKGSVKYETNVDGTVNYNKVVLGGDTYDNSTHTGGTTISNVAAGVKDSDAVNKHQLDQVNNSVTNIAEGKDGMFQVNNTSKLPKPKPTGKDAVAGGAGALASGDNSLALGTSSKATHNNSVALGNNSVTDRDNSVSVGSVGGERQIANVAAGTQGTDAVNVNQLKQGVSNAYNYTDNKFNDLKNMVDDQKDKLSAGISGAMAMASLPQPYQPGASMVSMGGGTYQGESAVALGVSTISDNGKWVTKLSGTTTSQGDLGAAVGVGYQW